MALRAEQTGGWEIVVCRPEYDGVELVGYHDRAGHGLEMRILPEPGVTIVLLIDGELRIDQTRPVAAGIASGVGVNSVDVHGRDVACVDIHLSPLAAHPVLDGPSPSWLGPSSVSRTCGAPKPVSCVPRWRAPIDGTSGSAYFARRSPGN